MKLIQTNEKWFGCILSAINGTQQQDSDYRLQRASGAFMLTNGFCVIKKCH